MHDDFYQMYLEEMKTISPCTKEEQERLLEEAAKGVESAKKRLVEGNLRAALEYALGYDGKGVLLTDLVQEANMALVIALEEYMEEYKNTENRQSFDSYFPGKIREALDAAVAEQESAARTGEELTARANVLTQVSQLLAKELGREATVEELAEKMKMTEDEIRAIMKMAMDAMSSVGEEADLEALSGIEETDEK